MRELERELGVDLFDRQRSKMRLTVTGEVLRVEARELMRRTHLALSHVRSYGRGIAGKIRIGLTDDFISSEVFARILEFSQQHESIEIETSLEISTVLASQLAEGSLDVALVNIPLDDDLSDFGSLSLPSTRILLVVRRDHPWADLKTVDPQSLDGHPLISMPADSRAPFAKVSSRMLTMVGASPRTVHATNSPDLQLQLVRKGFGVAMLSEESIGPWQEDLVCIPIDHPLAVIEHVILYRRLDTVPAVNHLIMSLSESGHTAL